MTSWVAFIVIITLALAFSFIIWISCNNKPKRKSINDMLRTELIAHEEEMFNRLIDDKLSLVQLMNYEGYTRMIRRMIDEAQ